METNDTELYTFINSNHYTCRPYKDKTSPLYNLSSQEANEKTLQLHILSSGQRPDEIQETDRALQQLKDT